MVTKSKLKMALAADKGVDFKKLHLKKKEKAAKKGNVKKHGGDNGPTNGKKVEEEWEDVEEEAGEDDVELDEDESSSEEGVEGPMKVCFTQGTQDLSSNISTD
jgi:rRNA-processing protein EBP2